MTRNLSFFYHFHSHRIFFGLFLLAFFCQIFFWKQTENIRPNFEIVPPAPSRYVASVLSLGDKEFLFYALALRLQNAGDVFAGFAALKLYDYSRLYQWMKALDELNNTSNLVPALASYYYSQTQNKPDTRYIVNYLDEHVDATTSSEALSRMGHIRSNVKDLEGNNFEQANHEKWWWRLQAIFIAKDLLKDEDLALKLAYKISETDSPSAPFWLKTMPALISKQVGDGCTAFTIIRNLLEDGKSGKLKITPKDMEFMRQFIEERLKKMKGQRFDPRKCQ